MVTVLGVAQQLGGRSSPPWGRAVMVYLSWVFWEVLELGWKKPRFPEQVPPGFYRLLSFTDPKSQFWSLKPVLQLKSGIPAFVTSFPPPPLLLLRF